MDESPSPSDMASATTPTDRSERGKPKQKRNKPTLSCEECVERKTKVCCDVIVLSYYTTDNGLRSATEADSAVWHASSGNRNALIRR